MRSKHLIQCCGAKVGIQGDRVEVLSEPWIHNCPLHESLYGFKAIDKNAVKKTVEYKIRAHGFCCEHRTFKDALVVSYGASEIIKTCLEAKLLDCAVIVCEGAGTVITSNPSLVQGIGAHLTGIMKTSPVDGIIQQIKARGGSILDAVSAPIDQSKGFLKAVEMGFSKVAVTVAGFQARHITWIRRLEKQLCVEATVFSVCNTCISVEDVKHIANADIVTASASKIVRNQIGPKALMQIGVTIPVFALTKKGKGTMLTYLSEFDQNIVAFKTRLPYIVAQRGPTLRT